jgi:chromosome segregation ATPase
MTSESDSLKIGRLEDKFNLYEPILVSLQRIASVPAEITKMQDNLQELRDSSVAVKEQLTTLFSAQDRVYKETVKSLEEQTRLMEKEIANCPIVSVVAKVGSIERDMDIISALDDRLDIAESAIDSFKLKGWDLIFKIVPWMIAAGATSWATFRP